MSRHQSETMIAYIGLGGNLGVAAERLLSARQSIAMTEGISEIAFSSLYRSTPMGPSDQPDYVNAVMGVATSLSPHDLLRALQEIELAYGRVRTGERWGARTLDLDILLYGEQEIDTPELKIPHPGLVEREFVLYPLYEIAPDLCIPGKEPLTEWVNHCPRRGLMVINHG
jgi:2-amino-4-hydroxy-6-hydroxymethyldihydropteridine diphosphokinase